MGIGPARVVPWAGRRAGALSAWQAGLGYLAAASAAVFALVYAPIYLPLYLLWNAWLAWRLRRAI